MSKPVYKITVTLLEKFRRYMVNPTSFDTEQALLDSLRGVFKGTAKTCVGQAFHELIQYPDRGVQRNIEGVRWVMVSMGKGVPAVALPIDIAQRALDHKRMHAKMVLEVPATKMYDTTHGPVMLSGRMDGVEGIIVRDTKVKFAPIMDLDEYLDSLQWRVYLDMMGVPAFGYDIFEMSMPEPELHHGVLYVNNATMRDPESIMCYEYNGMAEDIHRWLEHFMAWASYRRFFYLLKTATDVDKALQVKGKCV